MVGRRFGNHLGSTKKIVKKEEAGLSILEASSKSSP